MNFEPTFKNIRKFNEVKFKGNLSDYNLYIAKESRDTFTLTDNGEVVGDESTRNNFMRERRILGFEKINDKYPRNETLVKKSDSKIKGTWLKMVIYQDWLFRVIDEGDSYYLLSCSAFGLEEMGFTYFGNVILGYKIVDKAQVTE